MGEVCIARNKAQVRRVRDALAARGPRRAPGCFAGGNTRVRDTVR